MYKLASPTRKEEVVLTQRKGIALIIATLLLIFGTPIVFIGILSNSHIAAGIGIFLFCAAILVFTSHLYPKKFIFDNAHAVLRIIENDNTEYQIPYSKINDFQVGLHRRENETYFAVEMIKIDGAIWTFAMFANKQKAEKIVTALKNSVHLHAQSPSTGISSNEQPLLPNVQIIQKGSSTTIEWKQRHSIPSRIAGFGAIFSFAFILWNIAKIFTENIVGSFLSYGFAIIMVGIGCGYLFYSIGRIYVLEIGNEMVRYYTKGFFAKGLAFNIPIEQIKAVLFHMSIERADMAIYLLTDQQRQKLSQIVRGKTNIRDVFEDISFMMHLPRIDAGGFTVTEKLKLEKIIQNALSQYTVSENI
ncbi:MAG: hypothetical protein N2316_01375 [Spirochaetes bacterium]|nr:hypothetical protein [Spirochaetota bacterium]